MKRLLSSDPIGKKQTIYHRQGDEVIIETVQDVAPILEAAKAEKNAHNDYQRFKGDGFHKVATLPLWMLFKPSGGMLDDDELKARLRDPLFSNFRTNPGRV